MKLKQDKYRKSRGGYSRLLQVSCAKCSSDIAQYQKDGPGALKRMYLDRITSPDNLTKQVKLEVSEIPSLSCASCKEVVGIPYLYKPEKRKAFRLFIGTTTKRIIKNNLI